MNAQAFFHELADLCEAKGFEVLAVDTRTVRLSPRSRICALLTVEYDMGRPFAFLRALPDGFGDVTDPTPRDPDDPTDEGPA